MSKFNIISNRGRKSRRVGGSNTLSAANKRASNLCKSGKYDSFEIQDLDKQGETRTRSTVSCEV